MSRRRKPIGWGSTADAISHNVGWGSQSPQPESAAEKGLPQPIDDAAGGGDEDTVSILSQRRGGENDVG